MSLGYNCNFSGPDNITAACVPAPQGSPDPQFANLVDCQANCRSLKYFYDSQEEYPEDRCRLTDVPQSNTYNTLTACQAAHPDTLPSHS